MLYIFAGLPATGKSTLASALAQHKNACYLRIDTVEQELRNSHISAIGPLGYSIAYRIVADNLRLGHSVVADSVNPLEITRHAWREVAIENHVPYIEIEIICSHQEQHRQRAETRRPDIPGLIAPTWQEIIERDYEEWTTPHLQIDTAHQSSAQSILMLFKALEKQEE